MWQWFPVFCFPAYLPVFLPHLLCYWFLLLCFLFQVLCCSSLFFRSSSFFKHFLYLFGLCLYYFLRCWIVFTLITLNSFSVRVPISISLRCFSLVLSCSFVWDILSCHLILSAFMSLLFPFHQLQGYSYYCFCCLPTGGGGWSKRLVHTSWWEGLFLAHWKVELDHIPLVDSAVSKGVFNMQL